MEGLLTELKAFFVANPQGDLSDFGDRYRYWLTQENLAWRMDSPAEQQVCAGYTRHVMCQHVSFEVLLISWKPGACTPKHVHPQQGCLLGVLEGTLLERRYQGHVPCDVRALGPGQVSYLQGSATPHVVANASDQFAYSLHIYAPPGFYS